MIKLGDNIVVSDYAALENKILGIKADGVSELSVIMDFDHTITTFKSEHGGVTSTSFGVIAASGILGQDLMKNNLKQFAKYHPIEINPAIPKKEKLVFMEEWWNAAIQTFIDVGLKECHVQGAVDLLKGKLSIRKNVKDLFNLLKKHNIPLVILSAGIGDIVTAVLNTEFDLSNYPNMTIRSNFFDFNDQGVLVGWKGKTIHCLNKCEAAFEMTNDQLKYIHTCKNIILVGDHIGDSLMADAAMHTHVLRIAFLNLDTEKRLPQFQLAFDIVILEDQHMTPVMNIIGECIPPIPTDQQ